jgi:hypothetical protein
MSDVAVTTIKFEQTEIIKIRDNFESNYDADFARLLENSQRTRAETLRAAEKNYQERRSARKELDDELRAQREELDKELKKARRRYEDVSEAVLGQESQSPENQPDDGKAFGADRVHIQRTMASVVMAGSILPGGFRSQLGTSLMASGKAQNGLNGFLLNGGSGRSTQLLKNTLEKLSGMGDVWSLDKEALADLGQIFVDSGVDPEEAFDLLSSLGQTNLTLDNVLRTVAKADDLASRNLGVQEETGLTATAAGLNNLGQFLASLGLSSEVIKGVTSSLAPGQSFTSHDLRGILSRHGDEVLAPLLVEGDLASLSEALKGLGASPTDLANLSVLLTQTQGRASLDDLLGLLAFSEQPKSLSPVDPQKMVVDVQNLLNMTSRESELVKTPLFNEIILKLTMLGDRELSDDFSNFSPALQALRGGLSVLRDGHNQGFAGQGGGGRGSSGQEREERLMAMSGINSETVGRGLETPQFQAALGGEGAGYVGETLARQIGQKLIYSVKRGIHRLKMDLAPETLGRLDIELKVENDKLTAFIKADSLEAYEALEKEMSSLKASLDEAGIKLALTLSYDGEKDQESLMARTGHDDNRRGRFSGQEAREDGSGELARAAWPSNDRLLDAVV